VPLINGAPARRTNDLPCGPVIVDEINVGSARERDNLTYALATLWWLLAGHVHFDGLISRSQMPVRRLCSCWRGVILEQFETGIAGVRRLLVRLFDHRPVAPGFWLPLLLLMPAIYRLTYAIIRAVGLAGAECVVAATVARACLFRILCRCGRGEIGYTAHLTDRMLRHWS
jgi:hypothetical protein